MQGLRPRKAALGLDIGTGAVKLVEWSGGAIRSCSMALRERTEDASHNSGVRAIRDAVRLAAPRARRVALGLNGAGIVLHRFVLPKDLTPAEREEQARLQAGQTAPFPLEEAAFDYAAEGTTGPSQSFRMAIARSASVEALCRIARLSGLHVAAVDVTSCAIQRALAATTDREAPVAVLDGGHRQTRITVYRNGERVFHHSQPYGCSELAGRLSSAYGLSDKEANKALAEYALPGGAASRITKPFLKGLARHAGRAMQLYLTSRNNAAAPARMLMWGGAALLPGACQAVRDELDLPVEVLRAPATITGAGGAPDIAAALFGAYALARNDHA